MALMSKYFFTAAFCMSIFAALAYLGYTISWSKAVKSQLAFAQKRGKHTVKFAAQGGTAVLEREPEVEISVPVNKTVKSFGRLGTTISWFTIICLGMSMLFRAIVTQHAPWANMYEYSIAFSFALTLAYLIFEIRYHSRALGVFATGMATLMMLFAIYVGIAYNQATAQQTLIPALQDKPILTIHVSMAIFAYAFFTVAFGCALINLLQGDENRHAWLPTGEAADELGYKSVIIGFPLLALNLILGAYWANYAWGHYWSWDPKETSALVTWLIYAIYLHARGMRGWTGTRASWLLVAGFAATMFTYFGVSFLIPGLHSYAGVK